ncbi:MAG: hypothetical protein ACI8VC_000457 [Candidatus Endobugula sp.]|jgi:hypothetical protein
MKCWVARTYVYMFSFFFVGLGGVVIYLSVKMGSTNDFWLGILIVASLWLYMGYVLFGLLKYPHVILDGHKLISPSVLFKEKIIDLDSAYEFHEGKALNLIVFQNRVALSVIRSALKKDDYLHLKRIITEKFKGAE